MARAEHSFLITPRTAVLFIPCRLSNIAYDVFQLYCYEMTDTNHYPAYQTRRPGILPRIGKIWFTLLMHFKYREMEL